VDSVRCVLSGEELVSLQAQAARVAVDDALVNYTLEIVEKTRTHESLMLGVSPRGAQALYRASQALALSEGRDYVIPDDVKRLVIPVCAHRVAVNTRAALSQRNAEASERILQDILTQVAVPL
jgi:MoxR-like ATPase